MDVKEAIAAARKYISEIYSDEAVSNLGLEEVEQLPGGDWAITMGFSRPWNTPRTRAQEVLENIGAVSPLRRSYKIVTIDGERGSIISMKNRPQSDAAA